MSEQKTKPTPVKLPRQGMPKQDPDVRKGNFDEVALGYTQELAQAEASRCLLCKNARCIAGCPVEIDIPGFILAIRRGNFEEALRIVRQTNNLPAICGRVCPQEEQCEKVCALGIKGQPVAIGRLERFAADWEMEHGELEAPEIPASSGKKVAVVGSGPSGLTAAADLAKMGHQVTIFEALHKAGGVLVYGIPEFRLPKSIVARDVDYVKSLGVEISINYVIGRTFTVDELIEEEGYQAVYLGNGAGLPYFMQIPGENLNGVYSANEFLTRVNLMKAYLFPKYDTPIRRGKRVAVIGAGNVTMDSARTALRLGAEEVYVVYRRSRAEMPAREEEIENAEEEGIKFQLLTAPVRIIGNGNNWVNSLECQRMELGEPDASGRRRPIPIAGSEFQFPVDTVVVAIGQGANPLVASTTRDLETRKGGYIVAKEETGQTNRRGIFAGGDIVTGAATVISAMGAGKRAAVAIDQYLRQL